MQRRLRDQLLTNYMVAPLLPCSRIIEGAPNRTNTHAAIRVERRRRRRRTTAVVVVGPTGNQTKSLPKWRRKQFTHTHAVVAQHNHHRRHRHHHHHPQCLSLACLLTPPLLIIRRRPTTQRACNFSSFLHRGSSSSRDPSIIIPINSLAPEAVPLPPQWTLDR